MFFARNKCGVAMSSGLGTRFFCLLMTQICFANTTMSNLQPENTLVSGVGDDRTQGARRIATASVIASTVNKMSSYNDRPKQHLLKHDEIFVTPEQA